MTSLVKSHRHALAILLLFLHVSAFSQIVAKFSASPVSGCSPLIVNFTDQSTGNPTQWRWDLGNGSISTLKNPSATYFNAGSYTVKLVAKNASGADSIVKTQFITVRGNPVVDFKASDTMGCFPLPVQFTDISTLGSGTIATWQWDFGDGSLSSSQTASHVYGTSGNYTVTLKVANNYGCLKTLSKTQYIRVSNGVTAGFTNNTPGVCSAPVTIQFTNTSTGPGSMTYVWDFGDGKTSTAANPSHNYSSNGSYTVRLVAVSPQGCRDTIKKLNLLNIGAINTGFTVANSVCVNQGVDLHNTSTPTPSTALWDFGDGTTSTEISPSKLYTAIGSYTIKVINNYGGCVDSAFKTITVVSKPHVDFTANNTPTCQLPVTVQYQAQNATGTSLLWNFGDGTSSTASSPIHTYTAEGNYTVMLVATNSAGCSDTVVKADLIKIVKPNTQLANLPASGCGPLTINPIAILAPGNSVQSYLWKFGDGTTSTAAAPSHTYSNAGVYTVSLLITTTRGCKDSAIWVDAVRVGSKPHANFIANPLDVCANYPVSFTDASTGTIDQWHWNFGDGDTSVAQNPQHYYTGINWIDVQLVVSNNNCADTITLNHLIHVRPPVASFDSRPNCNNKLQVNFTDHSTSPQTWFWEFGDGSTSTLQNPSHIYLRPGSYNVSLLVTNGSCVHRTQHAVTVIDEKANFVSDTLACKNITLAFNAPNIHGQYIASWNWDFGDGTISNTATAATHSFAKSGDYTVTLTITDSLGCIDASSRSLHIFGPVADFSSSASAMCLQNNAISFADHSTSDNAHPVTKWVWSFGDGTVDSVHTTPSHQYSASGNYDISLKVKDSYGCSDEQTKTAAIIISQPIANFFAIDTVSCTNQGILFTNTSTANGAVYDWNFSDGTQSQEFSPLHNFASIGNFSISLKVTDQYGCKDSVTKTNYISISYPKAMFKMSDSIGTCPPLIVNFTNESTDYTSVQWDFGDGTFSQLVNPSHFYNAPGTYYPKLLVAGPGGCTDTISRKIYVKGPNGSFTYQSLSGCNPLTVSFKATTQNTSSFVWDFSDGNTLVTPDSIVFHTYTTPGDFVPKMILVDPGGCNFPIVGKDTIQAYSAAASFDMSTTRLCNAGTIQFTNTTLSNDLIASSLWKFGDGTTSSAMNPSHDFTALGPYTVQLITTTAHGCMDSITLIDSIQVVEKPVISISGDSAACIPASFAFQGIVQTGNAATMKWNWSLGNGQSATQQNAPAQTYVAAGSYDISAIVTADNGCKDTATKSIELYPLPSTNAGADMAICRGSAAQLNATGASNYVWNNTALSCTNCAAPLAAPTNATAYVVTGYNSFGCSKTDTVMVKVYQPFVLSISPGDTICAGEIVHLNASGAATYSWLPSTTVSMPNAGSTTAKPLTSITYQVIAKDAHNCFVDTASVYVKVWPLPTVNAGADESIVVGDGIQLHATGSSDVTSWQWNNGNSLSCFNCASPAANPKQQTTYTVQVKNDGGCIAQDAITVFVTCNKGNLFIPNTFSPNGDGVNDKFYPNGKGINMIKSLRIFNRWGEVVFERSGFSANDPSLGWDGSYKGQLLSPDVYIYTCDVVCQNNEVLTFKGDVTLLR